MTSDEEGTHPLHFLLPSFKETLYNTSTIPATPSSTFNMTAAHVSTPVNMLFTYSNTGLFADIGKNLAVGLETGAINDLDSLDEWLVTRSQG
ncbi:hypothetical protein BLNAU_22948 [Blattamonas nauphoetae]|uniref:Uncharacterized protein n=1 Tax=Blattamonas nauphoetae TaxID=2049346 RepID=A0ABQ9WS34_9EUKA|nr:hypothetical protein BLNAU_22948 [Blattamonas nauphoetae]